MRHETPLTGLRAKPVTVHTAPKGLDFVRAGIAKALHPNHYEALEYAALRWGAGSRVVKTALPGLNTQTDGGDQMTGDEGAAAEFFELVRAASIIGRLPVRRIPFHVPTLSMDEGARCEWSGEGKGKRTSPLKLTRVTGLARLKVAGLIVATNEMLQQNDVSAEMIIRNDLVKALATAVDTAFIDPNNSGSANVKPAAITSGMGGDSPQEALWEFYDTFTGDPDNAYILMHPFTAARLYGAARPDVGARGGTWAGFPVITSSAVEPDLFIFLDPDQIAVAMDGGGIRASQQADVDLQDSSTQSAATTITATNVTSMFQTNSTALLGEVAANWRLIRDNAVMVFAVQSFGL